jgi:lipopolysaccharide export LptBFGC system permease protein LptF
MLSLNQSTYGDPFVTGYTFVGNAGEVQEVREVEEGWMSFLFPFGLHVPASGKHVLEYLFSLFWWLSALAILGLPMVVANSDQKTRRARRTYAVISILLAIMLGIWYGSWTFADNPDPTQITIANSYVRYWLPLFLLSTPFIASTILWVGARAQTKMARFILTAIVLVFTIWLNVRIVFLEGQDAIINTVAVLNESRTIRVRVLSRVPEKSVIIVDRADKIFFPHRHVIYPLRDEKTYALIPTIVDRVPLYYYGVTLPQKDLAYLNQKKLPDGIAIEFVESFGIESLYLLSKR